MLTILTTGTPVRSFCGMVKSLYKHQYLVFIIIIMFAEKGLSHVPLD